jgi:hypothetical protein
MAVWPSLGPKVNEGRSKRKEEKEGEEKEKEEEKEGEEKEKEENKRKQ